MLPVKCAPSDSYVPPTMVAVVVALKDRAPGSDSLIKLDEQRRADNLSDSFKNYVRILNRSRMYIIQMYQVKLWRGLKLKEEALIGAMFDGVMIIS